MSGVRDLIRKSGRRPIKMLVERKEAAVEVVGWKDYRGRWCDVVALFCGVRNTHKFLAFCKFFEEFGQCPSPS